MGKYDPAGTAPSEGVELGAGEMAVYVSIDDRLAGRIVLRDEVRPDATQVLQDLHAAGVSPIVMVTGDAAANAQRVADEVGADVVHASLLPADKIEVVSGMRPRPVLMVGDGINDAPVLAAADVGIAMGARGATAASESAEAVLLVDELTRIPAALRTARRTMVIARQSIIIGIGLSIGLMAIAATGVIPAVFGALLQEAIDVVTILNGLRAGAARSATRTRPIELAETFFAVRRDARVLVRRRCTTWNRPRAHEALHQAHHRRFLLRRGDLRRRRRPSGRRRCHWSGRIRTQP